MAGEEATLSDTSYSLINLKRSCSQPYPYHKDGIVSFNFIIHQPSGF
jgi:hypothetical protein